MHTYSIDNKIRGTIEVALFFISIIISMLLKEKLDSCLECIRNALSQSEIGDIVTWIQSTGLIPDLLSAAIIYGLFSKAWNKCLWKWKIFSWVHGVPNLAGEWEGELTSSFNNVTIPIKMTVDQTWSRIRFNCQFSQTKSNSYSNVAAIYVNGEKGTEIYFGFVNQSDDVETGMQVYDGYNVLILDGDHIDARYFNNRPHPDPKCKGGNKGVFKLDRVK